jgi:plasmid stabilization system protein ParE
MPAVFYSARALRDLERIVDFLAEIDPALAQAAVGAITDAVSVLDRHPSLDESPEVSSASWSSHLGALDS